VVGASVRDGGLRTALGGATGASIREWRVLQVTVNHHHAESFSLGRTIFAVLLVIRLTFR